MTERQPSGLWVCHSCLNKFEIGDYLHIRKIDTDYIKCKNCRKNLADFEFLTRYVRSPLLTHRGKR